MPDQICPPLVGKLKQRKIQRATRVDPTMKQSLAPPTGRVALPPPRGAIHLRGLFYCWHRPTCAVPASACHAGGASAFETKPNARGSSLVGHPVAVPSHLPAAEVVPLALEEAADADPATLLLSVGHHQILRGSEAHRLEYDFDTAAAIAREVFEGLLAAARKQQKAEASRRPSSCTSRPSCSCATLRVSARLTC